MNNNQVIIFEDEFEDFQKISSVLRSLSINHYPETIKEFHEFKVLYLKYILSVYKREEDKQTIENLISLCGKDPKLFILDHGLIDLKNEIDETGAKFRVNFLKERYRNTRVLFISKYSKTIIDESGGYQPNDLYIDKDIAFTKANDDSEGCELHIILKNNVKL